MRIFLDSANIQEVETWCSQGIIDGVTTNPSIMLKDGVHDLEEGARRLSSVIGNRPLSVEVTSNEHAEMLRQARVFSRWGTNIVVKIPVINEHGDSSLSVINTLTRENIAVNVTAILSFNQAILAAKAGATYVSIFAGRIADEGGDPAVVIRNVRKWLDEWTQPCQIIVGSVRSVMDVQGAALAGAHIITIPPPFFPKMLDHKYTRETVRQFNEDAQTAFVHIEHARTTAFGK